MPPYIFSLYKLKKFKSKYNPSFLARFGLFITKNSSEINFIHKLENLFKELESNIKNFGILNATFNHSLVDITLTKPNNNNFDTFKSIKISLNHNDPKVFFIFLLHKANIFDKKNIYGSLLKNIFPDNVLKQMLINILNFYVKMADEIRDSLSSYIHRIEEFRDILNKIKQRLENEKSLDWVQKELESLVFWYIKTILSILIDQKDDILNYLDNPKTLFDIFKKLISTQEEESTKILEIFDEFQNTNEEVIIKGLSSVKKFLLNFYKDYSDKKFGTTDESNLRGSAKFLQTEIVKKIYEDSTILDLYTNLITIAMKKTDNYSEEIILIVCQIIREVFLFYIRLYEAIFID
ncbi:hypothetical protein CWI38_1269p0010 [Hamiltosporidium tvaerminnensis]|uniref:Uncharacterized protein n=1 Tax=Hamiltosporidium tvaerminnensis TaxID=1176355 RepID=A0A4Q9LT44_9MICR|nr:hypothetical protein CWI38_1269p0010 [Hamiltosporidium tvaerminnensis]